MVLHLSSAHWVVFAPVACHFYCVEPVIHVDNAVQMSEPLVHDLITLASGRTVTSIIDLIVS